MTLAPLEHEAERAASARSRWSVCGNLLCVLVSHSTDDELRRASATARFCFRHGERWSDGVVCLSPGAGFVRTAFFNPDGSFEQLCGNSLFAASASLGSSLLRTLDGREIRVSADHSEHHAKGSLALAPATLPSAWGDLRVHDTGSPHAVLEVPDVASFAFGRDVEAFVRERDLNFTIASRRAGFLAARTFERGVFAETRGCGTGALAIALAAGRGPESVVIQYPGGRYRACLAPSGERIVWTLSVPRSSVVRLEDWHAYAQLGAGTSDERSTPAAGVRS